ncbi:SusF/SusE family outer membrane protein [Galbibacter mesophilus]|uniref:SusF/SusE family outer membrane protein n=1 Tax=Galbibacter mesophilus TaxID=379069 RepID=UPI00191F5F28|nr:SusF/SusE family outer membrane protein [Galbibacter mesophilus]MCM5661915.1 SusF/SusE family outer membrane protein [Galbibacter mesophilus]
MKKLSILLFAFAAIISFNACSDDDEFTFVAKPDPEGIAFENTPLASYDLEAENENNLAERFVWNAVDFDAPTPVKYELQAASDNTFEPMTVLAADISETNYGVTVKNMITLAEDAGLDSDPDTEAPNTGNLFFRVRAYVGDKTSNLVEQLSDTLSLNVVLVEPKEDSEPIDLKPQLFLVGDATAAGWDNNKNNTPLFRDGENENVFYFTGRFAGAADKEGFKLLENKGVWQPQWGLDAGALTSSDLLGGDPSAFKAESDAYYNLTIDKENLTYTWETFDASASPVYGSIGIIGDSTPDGWDADQDLTQSTFDPHIWFIEGIELIDGEAKFRVDDAWDISWGASTTLSGQGFNNNDPNIPVTAGTYNVWFNDLDGRYLFIRQVSEE